LLDWPTLLAGEIKFRQVEAGELTNEVQSTLDPSFLKLARSAIVCILLFGLLCKLQAISTCLVMC
jgi:hypothetical protein